MTAANGSPDPNPAAAPADESSIQIQPTPPAPTVTVSSTETPKLPSQSDLIKAETELLDRALIALTLVFACFLASFRATNSDVWMHLAAGRMIANGEYHFWEGTDPFSYTTEGTSWDNHNWLAELVMYGVAQLFGGPESQTGGASLVVLKAMIIMATAGLMLAIRRPGHGFWLPAVCTCLALLAMTPRLLLQPTCLSYLFLALTLWLLQQPIGKPAENASSFQKWLFSTRRRYALPVVFALWVNLDGWYLLGPLTVGLYLLGEWVQDFFFRHSSEELPPGELKQLGIVLGLGLAACLLSPYHVRSLFSLPPELATFVGADPLLEDNWFNGFFSSPFSESNLSPAGVEFYQNIDHLAVVPLFVVSLASFACNLRGWRWWRAAVFVPFAALAFFWARAVPFFAVVAGPITVLNFQDYATRLASGGEMRLFGKRSWGLTGRLATALTMIAMLVVAWPGLLHANSDDARVSRRVGLGIQVNESFRNLSAALADLRKRQVLKPDSHGFNLSPEIGNYCAWFCPEEKSFFDLRMHLFDDSVSGPYVRSRLELEMRSSKSAAASGKAEPVRDAVWPQLFRDPKRPIDHVILTAGEWNLAARVVVPRFWADWKQWTMLYGDGRTFIFGWNDPRQPPRFEASEFDLVRQAFATSADGADSELAHEMPPVPHAQEWWSWYVTSPTIRPLALDQAEMFHDYLEYAAKIRQQSRQQTEMAVAQRLSSESLVASGIATSAPMSGVVGRTVTYAAMPYWELHLVQDVRLTPEMAAAPLISLRYAREAVIARPNDGEAWLTLAKAQRRLDSFQRDVLRGRGALPPATRMLDELRQVQMSNDLKRAIDLKPDLAEAHKELAELYARLGSPDMPTHIDLYLTHLHQWAELRRAELERALDPDTADRQRKEVDRRFRTAINQCVALKTRSGHFRGTLTEEQLKTPDEFLSRLKSSYALKAENQPDRARIFLALEYGLAEQALSIAPPPSLARNEMLYIISLNLSTGLADQAQEILDKIPDPSIALLTAAARGNYADMDGHLGERVAMVEQAERSVALRLARSVFTTQHGNPANLQGIQELMVIKHQECDVRVLRGMLALESGNPAAAARHFESALKYSRPPSGVPRVVGALGAASPIEGVVYMRAAQAAPAPQFTFDLQPLARYYLARIESNRAK
jgi:hypothetical protein